MKPLPRIDGLLVDIAGVVHVAGEPVPGAVASLRRWRDAGRPLRFVTNTTSKPAAAVGNLLHDLGVTFADGELFTAPLAARALLERDGLRPHFLMNPALAGDLAGLDTAEPNAVVVGDAGEGFGYPSLNEAFRILRRGGVRLIAMANNQVYRDADGALSLDAGPFVRLLAETSGVEPEVTGKPAGRFFGEAVASLGLEPAAVAMIGDDVESDVGGAQAAGLTGVLVRTGKFEAKTLEASGVEPDFVADDLATAIAELLR